MNKKIKILIGAASIFILLVVFSIVRYNLTFGSTLFEKSTMLGCMYKGIEKFGYNESIELCECSLGKLFKQYSENEIRSKSDNAQKGENIIIKACVKDFMNQKDKR